MNSSNTLTRSREPINLFLPIVLVGAGIILLMGNMGMLTRDPILFVVQFWPVFLIVGGIQLLFARTGTVSTLVSVLLAMAVVGGAVYYLTQPGPVVTPTWWNWNWNWGP